MIQYVIVRKEQPALTVRLLSARLQAFHTLYAYPGTNRKVTIKIEGRWPSVYGGDGLYFTWVPAEIISIGRKYIWVKYFDGHDEAYHRVQLELCPTPDTGFTEIRFSAECA